MLQLYNTALWPLRAVVGLWAGWSGRDAGAAGEWDQRRARALPRVEPGGVWLHGASVGEARIVSSTAFRLRERHPDLPVSVSAYTRAGRAQLPQPPAVGAAFFIPLDFAGLPGRVLDAVRPRCLALVETEIWPNLLHEADARAIPVALINGRLSPERMSRYRRLRRLYRPLMRRLARVGAQSAEDADRFLELGVSRSALTVTGNVKYDLPAPQVDREALRRRLGLEPGRPVLVAGSTAPGEDERVLDAVAELHRRHPGVFLILAPRHTDRAHAVARLLAERGMSFRRCSQGPPQGAARDGLLVDTIGELAALYAIGTAAFVGGSLVPRGGHNVLEPAAAGVPVLFGPHTGHVSGPARALLEAGGARRVDDAAGLARAWSELIADREHRERMGRAAAGVIESNRGALQRSVALIEELLERSRP